MAGSHTAYANYCGSGLCEIKEKNSRMSKFEPFNTQSSMQQERPDSFRGGFRGGGGEIYFFVKIYNNFIIL